MTGRWFPVAWPAAENTSTSMPTGISNHASFCHVAVDNIRRTTLREALGSPLFRKIREKQGEHDNLLRPCMLIDHPDVGREIFASEGAYATHEGAEEIFTGLADKMDAYSSSYAEIAESGLGYGVCRSSGQTEKNDPPKVMPVR